MCAEQLGKDDVDPAGTTFDITSDSGAMQDGQEIYYVGYRTGWQRATIEDTCDYFEISEVNQRRLICVGRARVTDDSDAPRDGDSGAPVFRITDADDPEVALIGTLFAHHEEDDDVFYFSTIGGIYLDLGSSLSWETCTSGC